MIKLPPKNERVEEEELYTEYVEIHEGSGYLPTMDGRLYLIIYLASIKLAGI